MPDRARPPDGLSPEQIITATMRRLEAPHPELAAKQVLADLTGHRYELVHRPPAPEPCQRHPNTKLDARGNCPICGPKGL